MNLDARSSAAGSAPAEPSSSASAGTTPARLAFSAWMGTMPARPEGMSAVESTEHVESFTVYLPKPITSDQAFAFIDGRDMPRPTSPSTAHDASGTFEDAGSLDAHPALSALRLAFMIFISGTLGFLRILLLLN
ncbi:hypothetical protein LTR36_003060 [Oleoguttula mirabilis]|uniref:Uncharacterized protein n=1 Tax=Oleoguttula mirabilis TaxID=1507867 RepID=A0AAV9JWU9_9PEZI|nr:hypothetical protein LTR36_003060 [Oleoguttula mirabilis]